MRSYNKLPPPYDTIEDNEIDSMMRMADNTHNITVRQSSRLWFKCAVAALLGIIMAVFVVSCAMAANVPLNVNTAVISQIESSNNPRAYNKSGRAYGLCQITRPVLIEYNVEYGTHHILNDLFNMDLNLLVAEWYLNDRIPVLLRHYKIKDTIENRLRAYNSGIGSLVKGRYPKETRNYVKKYKRLMEQGA